MATRSRSARAIRPSSGSGRRRIRSIKVKSFADAAAFGEVVVLAVAGQVALEALKLVGPKALHGKTVIDATNPIGGGPPVNGVLSYFTTLKESLMERLQKACPDAHFVKAFNSVGNAQMVNPHFSGGRPTMFICGNDDGRQEDGRGDLRPVRLGRRRTWARSRRRAPSSRSACSGASPEWRKGDWSPHAFKLLR